MNVQKGIRKLGSKESKTNEYITNAWKLKAVVLNSLPELGGNITGITGLGYCFLHILLVQEADQLL